MSLEGVLGWGLWRGSLEGVSGGGFNPDPGLKKLNFISLYLWCITIDKIHCFWPEKAFPLVDILLQPGHSVLKQFLGEA